MHSYNRSPLFAQPALRIAAVCVFMGICSWITVAGTAPASASGTHPTVQLTVAARVCPTYTSITANRARNDIQESLRDLGADTPYRAGQAIDPDIEQSHQANCQPIPNWKFTLGTGYRTRAVSGTWGSLSIVTNPYSPLLTTSNSVPLLDANSHPTGRSIAGAVTTTLTPDQAQRAARPNSLWIQGGTTTDPVLNTPYPSQYGFGALRCAIDNLNGDNVEWIGYPEGTTHVFCFAYYVQPPPTSGTIIVRKEVDAPQGTSETFRFDGNLSFNTGNNFDLKVVNNQSAQQQFYRAETKPTDVPWKVSEDLPPNWRLADLTCTSQNGTSTISSSTASREASIRLAASDVVQCTYRNAWVPPNGPLTIRKITHGNVGRFGFAIDPSDGSGRAAEATATTLTEAQAVEADPAPIDLPRGEYQISEDAPNSRGGDWNLTAVDCNGRDQSVEQPIHVSIDSDGGSVCTFENTFTPNGAIRIAKVTKGSLGTAGFVITSADDPELQIAQSATTKKQDVATPARGDRSNHLPLGEYVIQATNPQSDSGWWELVSVKCDGALEPFSEGKVTVQLTTSNPQLRCVFTNQFSTRPPDVVDQNGSKDPTNPEANLSVSKEANVDRVVLGNSVSYNIVVSNTGKFAADEVVLGDQPNRKASILHISSSKGSCARSFPIVCRIGSLEPGKSVRVSVKLRPKQLGQFVNSAVIGTGSADNLSAHSSAKATVKVVGEARNGSYTG